MARRALETLGTQGSSTNHTHTLHPEAKPGDLIIGIVNNRNGGFTSTPSDWTRRGSTRMFYHWVTAAETPGTTTYTWSEWGAANSAFTFDYFRGVDPSGPVIIDSTSAAPDITVPSTTWNFKGTAMFYTATTSGAWTISAHPANWDYLGKTANGSSTNDGATHRWTRQVVGSGSIGGEVGTQGGTTTALTTYLVLLPTTRLIPRSAGKSKIETFTASGTWTKDPLARQVRVTCVGGGGGGGSGRGQVGQNAGGGGGAGGLLSSHVFDANDLTSTVAVTVGAGGNGGAGVGGANGAGGVAGGTSSFGSYLRAVGGNAGTGGTSGSGTGGAASTSGATDTNVAGGLGEDTVPGVAAANVVGTRAAGSGGGGGGSNTGPTATAGGNGGGNTLLGAAGGAGGAAGVANPSDGTSGSPGSTGGLVGGGGGGGGAAMGSTGAPVSGLGGAGGFPGGGGGGGGAAPTNSGSISGAGGAGAHGRVTVEVIY